MTTRFWWVSQNQTYTHEVGGGYLWAPTTNKKGVVTTSYGNMTKIRQGDIIFSFAGKEIKAVGVALGNAFPAIKPRVFKKAGAAWNDDGWKVDVLYVSTVNPIQPRNHMMLLAPLLPNKHSPIRKDGTGNQVYLCEISSSVADTLLALTFTAVPEAPALLLSDLAFDPEEQALVGEVALAETVKATLIQARRGQGLFRSRVQSIENACRVTNVDAKEFLVASHIKPWKDSDNDERLDGNNGLFLSPHIDKLFDGGFISFTQKGKMLVSPQLELDVLKKWAINPSLNYGRFNADQAYFLTHHNEVLFQAT